MGSQKWHEIECSRIACRDRRINSDINDSDVHYETERIKLLEFHCSFCHNSMRIFDHLGFLFFPSTTFHCIPLHSTTFHSTSSFGVSQHTQDLLWNYLGIKLIVSKCVDECQTIKIQNWLQIKRFTDFDSIKHKVF
jgi:hypothetical protein